MVTTHFLVITKNNPADKPKYKLFPTEPKAEFFCKTLPQTTTHEIQMVSEETD